MKKIFLLFGVVFSSALYAAPPPAEATRAQAIAQQMKGVYISPYTLGEVIDQTLITAGAGDITQVTAGAGLTGGGTTGALTLNVGAGSYMDVAADAIAWNPSKVLGSITFGDGSTDTIAWTWNRLTGTDPSLTFGDGTIMLNGDWIGANYYASGQSYYLNTTGTRWIKLGTGSPEGAATGGIGSIYLASDGTTNTTMWIKEAGTGNTGWRAFGSSGGSVATDAIWDAAGDLAVGSGANTASKLTMGSALQVLRVNAGATALEYATLSSGGNALTTDPLSQFAATTSAQLRGVLSDESGTGVFLTSNGSAASLTSFPTFNQNTTGSAATLTTARTINGVSFNGSANITVPSDITPGTSGNVLTSNGTVWTSAAAAGNMLLATAQDVTARKTFTDSRGKHTALGNVTGTVTIDWAAAMTYSMTATGNITLDFTNLPSTAGEDSMRAVDILMDGTGGWTVSYAASEDDPEGTDPVIDTTAGVRNELIFRKRGSSQLTAYGAPTINEIKGLGTGVGAALAVNTGSAGAFVLFNGALGTPATGNFSTGTFTWPTFNQNTTGSAATLTTSRNLWGVAFNGSANIGGAIELGAAGTTNATLDSSGAGAMTLEGVDVPTVSSAAVLTNKSLTFNAALGTDDTFTGIPISGLNNSGGVTQWDAVYLNSSSQWVIADADAAASRARGIAVATATTGNAVSVLTMGTIRNDAWNWTPGANLYLDTATAGGLNATAPTGTADVVQIIGYALTADIIFVNVTGEYLEVQ